MHLVLLGRMGICEGEEMKKPARKPRKPRRMRLYQQGPEVDVVDYTDGPGGYAVFPGRAISLSGEEARRLASWLTRFADWAEARKEIEG